MRQKRCSSLDLQIKGAENEHFSQKAEKKKKAYICKTKPVAPRGHPLLLLLFFQNKSCMHNEVGTCTEILPNLDVTISHIEIVFDFNVHTRAHFGLRAKKNFKLENFYRYVTRTIHSCFLPLMKRQQLRNVWYFTYFPRKKSILTSFFIFNNTTCLGQGTDKNKQGLQICYCFLSETYLT